MLKAIIKILQELDNAAVKPQKNMPKKMRELYEDILHYCLTRGGYVTHRGVVYNRKHEIVYEEVSLELYHYLRQHPKVKSSFDVDFFSLKDWFEQIKQERKLLHLIYADDEPNK